MNEDLRLVLPPTRRAPSMARRTAGTLDPGIPEEALADVRLLLTELVTNAVKHAGLRDTENIRVHVARHPDRVEVTVRYPDHNRFDPRVSGRVLEPGGGLGLTFVDTLADRWSIVETDGMLEAWFEIQDSRK